MVDGAAGITLCINFPYQLIKQKRIIKKSLEHDRWLRADGGVILWYRITFWFSVLSHLPNDDFSIRKGPVLPSSCLWLPQVFTARPNSLLIHRASGGQDDLALVAELFSSHFSQCDMLMLGLFHLRWRMEFSLAKRPKWDVKFYEFLYCG